MKKIIILVLLFAMISTASADLILNYAVYPAEVPLGSDLTISGTFVDDLNHSGNAVCSYYITDVNGTIIYQANDTKTNQKGLFTKSLTLTEPKFKRGTDYNAMAVCDEGTATKKFALGQRASAFHLAIWEIGWLSDEANVNLAFWIGLFIMVILGAIFGIKWIARKMQRGL